jgi:hypothetical protein
LRFVAGKKLPREVRMKITEKNYGASNSQRRDMDGHA